MAFRFNHQQQQQQQQRQHEQLKKTQTVDKLVEKTPNNVEIIKLSDDDDDDDDDANGDNESKAHNNNSNRLPAEDSESRSSSRDSGASSRFLSSSLSSSYAAEADTEGENENEESTTKSNANDTNLRHVQNFLNSFDNTKMLQKNVVQQLSGKSTMSTISLATTAATNKLTKFTISTKFLHTPRNKLKSLHMLSQGDSDKIQKTPTIMPATITKLQPIINKQQTQIQQPSQQLQIDEAYAKFKDFSINSLLNKK